jgi:YD repeat-containing protein
VDLSRGCTYNPIGNLTDKDGLSFDYTLYPSGSSTPKHAPGQVGNLELGYDARGNRSTLAGNGLDIRYEYDALNRLSYVFSDTTTTQFVYDGDGQRVKRITEQGTTVTIGQHYEVFYPAPPNQTLAEDTDPFAKSYLAADSEGGRHLLYGRRYMHLYLQSCNSFT